jgi:hypothetical protein
LLLLLLLLLLFSKSAVQLASQIHAKITVLSKTIQQALALRPVIGAAATDVDIKLLIAATNEQFQSIFEVHAEGMATLICVFDYFLVFFLIVFFTLFIFFFFC